MEGGFDLPAKGEAASVYVLGHSEGEFERLAAQAALVEPVTRQLLLDAGVGSGMRVLDAGTGIGDVAFLAGELVGAEGTVVGVERAPAAVAAARERARNRSAHNVEFLTGDPAELAFDSRFDAVVGRYVLQFQRDPSVMLRRLIANVRPGGIVAFHEIDWTGFRSLPPIEIWDRCCRAITQALAAGGAELQTGSKLPSIFAAAGLPPPAMRMTTIVGAGANCHDAVQRMVRLFSSLLPRIEALGALAPSELDPETLTDRVSAAVTATNSILIAASELTAWCRL
jgi:SAM-dependent methyltransferase